jgi:LEA14-like dessication related protein
MKLSLISAIIFLLLSLCSCRNLKEPVFKGIENVQMKTIGMNGSLMTLDLKYFNPNNINARMKNAEGDAWLDSTYLGHFYVDTTVDIRANSDFLIPVKLNVDMKFILQNSLASFLNEQVLIRIKGKAKLGKGGIYKKYPLSYEGKQNIKELLKIKNPLLQK